MRSKLDHKQQRGSENTALQTLTQPVLAVLVAKAIFVVSPIAVEVHRPVLTLEKHLYKVSQ
jgi:hypothetical protein